jgi:hypothetical protein
MMENFPGPERQVLSLNAGPTAVGCIRSLNAEGCLILAPRSFHYRVVG